MPAELTSIIRPWAWAWLAALPTAAWSTVTVLYNPDVGSQPPAQGWSTLALGGLAVPTLDAGRFQLDTSGVGVSIYGHGRSSPLALDTHTGFDLRFQLQLLAETHLSPHRAGYTLLMVGAQANRALELGFWADHVWAQDYDASQPDRFVHGVDAAFDTTVPTDYTLAVRQQQFTLSAGGRTLLSGPLRDYRPGGWPYTTANFLFLGDNSSRGNSISRLGVVSLSPVPEPTAACLLAIGLASLALRRR